MIEALIVLAIVLILSMVVGGAFLNTPGQTEERSLENAKAWVQSQNLTAKRLSCAHDSDGDGYASCTLVTQEDEKIYLQCPAGFMQEVMGAKSCKEIEMTIQSTRRSR